MPRSAPGPRATVAIVAVTALVFFFDRRRRKRAERLNQNTDAHDARPPSWNPTVSFQSLADAQFGEDVCAEDVTPS